MARQIPLDVGRLSEELSRVSRELAHVRGELQRYRHKLAALHGLIDALGDGTAWSFMLQNPQDLLAPWH
jgi:hypothetical protein